MITRIIVGLALGPAFLAALYLLPPIALAVVVAFIAGIASFELLRATGVAHHNGMYIFTALAAVLIPFGHALGLGSWTARAVAILLMAALFLPALSRYGTQSEIRFEHIIVCLFGGVGVPLFLSALVQLKRFDNGQFYVLLPIICAFTTDIGAYFFGVFLGKHRGITQVSPNKSLEGYILFPYQAPVRREGLRHPSPRPRRHDGPVRLHHLRRPHAAAAGGGSAGVLRRGVPRFPLGG